MTDTKRWTALLRNPEIMDGEILEEMDIDAPNRSAASGIAEARVRLEYEEGWEVAELIGPRYGLYL